MRNKFLTLSLLWLMAVCWGLPQDSTAFNGSVILGAPTDHSITVKVNFPTDQDEVFLEFGEKSGDYAGRTPGQLNVKANSPYQEVIGSLQPDSRYFYRVRFKPAGRSSLGTSPEYSFHTQRGRGSAFTFCIQGDSHPERASQFDGELYARTLKAAAGDRPDFYMTIGDDFSVDTLQTLNAATVTARYTLQLPYLGLVANSAPLFLVNGNHEQAARYLLDGTPNNVAVWAQNARNLYYAEPAPDGFYSGNTEQVPHIGLLRNYYAWEWGDALFVTIDPYWSSPVPVDNVLGGGSKTANKWDITHGEAQYQWLKNTLEASKAKWKFVFAHHVVGTGRGAVEVAPYYEWGGKNPDGSWGFAANRPSWPLPIHQLMSANHVTIFFQGHDHLFVRQELDGVTYQELPEPADPGYTLWNSDAYVSGDKFSNTGYVRVNVTPSQVRVDYVRTWLPKDEKPPNQVNGMVQFSYTISASEDDAKIGLAIPALGSAAMFTPDRPATPQSGYATVATGSGIPPYGTAVFDLTQNNVVTTECGVPDSPPTTRARLFVDYGTGVILPQARSGVNISTGIALVNPETATANITYTLRNSQGLVLAVGHGVLTAGAHRARYLNELAQLAPDFRLPPDFPLATRFGTLEVAADQPLSVLALRLTDNQRKETILTGVPIVDMNVPASSARRFFPQIVDGGGYTTRLVMLNTTEQYQSGRVRFFGSEGAPLIMRLTDGTIDTTSHYAIAPGGLWVLQTDGSRADTTMGWAEVVPDAGSSTPAGAGIFSLTKGDCLITESAVPAAEATTRALVYVDMSRGHDSGIAVAAIDGKPLRLDMKARRSNGTAPAGDGNGWLDLPGKGHRAAFAWQWVAGLEAGFQGVLEISAPSEFAAVTLRSLVNARKENLWTTFPVADLTRPATAPLLFPQIADGDGVRTEIILLSGGDGATATVSFFGDEGAPLPILSTSPGTGVRSAAAKTLQGSRDK